MPSAKKRKSAEGVATTRSQQAAALLRLRELLLKGEFPAGERMRELQLAARLGVSRTPLRLALSTLQHEGLLEMHPARGFIVRAFSPSDVLHAIEIRGLLEGMAGRLVVKRLHTEPAAATPMLLTMKAVIAKIDVAVGDLDAAPEHAFQQYVEFNRSLHTTLLEAAGSGILRRELKRVMSLPFAAPSSGFVYVQGDLPESRQILRIGQDQHHAILDALEARDGSRVESLLREHALLAQRNLAVVLAQQKGGRNLPVLPLLPEHL